MEIKIIRTTTLVAEITAIMMRLAAALENESPTAASVAARAAETALCEWMEPHEAIVLVAIVIEERRRCARCSKAVSYTRCSGPVCLMCAKSIRLERLNKDWSDSHGS